MLLFLEYAGCSTCKKAKKWLDAHGAEYTDRPIVDCPPTVEELRAWQAVSGLPLKKVFNTSGQQYRQLGLSAALPTMSEAEQLELLAGNGMLVKRPLLIGEGFVLVGFREEAWAAAVGQG